MHTLPGPLSRSAVAGVVLAAGRSTRFGRNKLLLPFQGEPLIRRVVSAALSSRLSSVIVVLGHDNEAVRSILAGLADDPRLVLTVNPSYRDGQSGSVITGLACIPPSSTAAMFLVGDQPLLDSSIIDKLVASFEAAGRGICYPVSGGRRGNPVIFAAEFFDDLRRITGDEGGRAIIADNCETAIAVDFPEEIIFEDIDSPGDYERFLSLSRSSVRAAPAADLVQALGLEDARVITLCGAGGKSSLMMALVREWSAASGERILATTTTKLGADELCGPWTPFAAANVNDILSITARSEGAWLAYSRHDLSRSRLFGFSPEVIDAVAACGDFTRMIVEADGARRLPLKAPGENEPVCPASTDVLVAVAGLGGLGTALGEDTVFRPERWTALTGLPPLARITAESLSRVIVHPEGLMSGAPPHVRRVVFLNQVDLPGRADLADAVLDHIGTLDGYLPDRIVIGQLRPAPLIHAIRSFGAQSRRLWGANDACHK
jgi:molybdenum cofactor cytidylyltransferase